MIPFEQLQKGKVYKLNSRNLLFGVFNGRDGFIGIRIKFGQSFLFTEIEYTQNDNYGTARATEEVNVIPENIPLQESIGTVCEKCNQPVVYTELTGWRHANNTVLCKGAFAMAVSNKELFDLLDEIEKKAGAKE